MLQDIGTPGDRQRVYVARAEMIAHDVKLFDLRRRDGAALTSFEAGAHIDLFLPSGVTRQYSLASAPAELDHYSIAVAREADSRGGSVWLHDQLRAGDDIDIGAPRCHFPLVETAPHSVLIAGGIGITPIWCMAQRLGVLGRPYSLHYAARTRAHAAFLAAIKENRGINPLATYFNIEDGAVIDLAALASDADPGSHFYACGPTGMIAAYRDACTKAGVPADHVHFELFASDEAPAIQGGFDIELARSGRTIGVRQGETILAALTRNGVRGTYSCREGVCGSCETRVLAGIPDHRDAILTDEERAAGETMMICCSGALSSKLVLDL